MILLGVDATSYDDYTIVGNKFIAILRMAERNKFLENRGSQISTLDLQTSIAKTSEKHMKSLEYYDDTTLDKPIKMYDGVDGVVSYHEEELGINYLMAYMSLYFKVVSNYEVLFPGEDTTKFEKFYNILNSLNLDLEGEFYFENDYSTSIEENLDYKALKEKTFPFKELTEILKMLLQGKTKIEIDTKIEENKTGGGMIGGSPIGIVAVFSKPVAAIWHAARISFLRDKVLDKLEYLYVLENDIFGEFSRLISTKPKTIKLSQARNPTEVKLIEKIFNAELINIFRMSFFSLLRTRGVGLNKLGNILLNCGICKSRIVYFILCYKESKGLNISDFTHLYLVFMYLRPKGVNQIYVHPFKLDQKMDFNSLSEYTSRKIGPYQLKKIPLNTEPKLNQVKINSKSINETIKEYFKNNHQFTMSYDIDYLIAKIDYAIKCETHTLAGKNKYKSIVDRIITFYKEKRKALRTRRRRKDMEKFFTGPLSDINRGDYQKFKGSPEMIYLHDIIENGLQINIDRPTEDLIRIVQEKEDEEIVDTERQELQTRRRPINIVRDSDIITAMVGNVVYEGSSGGGRKKTKKNINKIKNKRTNKIYSKKVRLN